MAARLYTGEELIAIVRQRVPLNDANTEGTTSPDILNVLNEEALTSLYSVVMRAREEYFVASELITISSATSRYRINPRAMHQKIRDLIYRPDSTTRHRLHRIQRDFRARYGVNENTSTPSGYDFEGNHILLFPDVGAQFSGQLEVSFFFRPGEIDLSTNCRIVQSVNPATGLITMTDDVPLTWTTALRYDFHSPYSGAEIKAWGLAASAVGGTGTEDKATFAIADVNGSTYGRYAVEAGDWCCVSEKAALPGLPREYHPALAQACVCRYKESRDPEGYQVSIQELQATIQRLYDATVQRDEGENMSVPILNSPHLGGRYRWSSYGKANYG